MAFLRTGGQAGESITALGHKRFFLCFFDDFNVVFVSFGLLFRVYIWKGVGGWGGY